MIRAWIRSSFRAACDGWNRFWFSPTDPAPLALIRIATGVLFFYSHLVWTLHTDVFFGTNSWLNAEAESAIRGAGYSWSPLWLIDSSPTAMTAINGFALIVGLSLAAGFYSRAAALAAFALTVSFANRNPVALYGFDQVLGFLTLYLCVNPGSGLWSIDSWRCRRRHKREDPMRASASANVALRLIQLHLCLIYLVAGLAKLKGAAWWSGVAMWGAIANLEYQTVDLTWLVDWPIAINLLTHVTLAWEISYCVLVWNPRLRPLIIALAVPVHLGIGICFGMMTFGLAMLVANLALVSPALIRPSTRRPMTWNQTVEIRDRISSQRSRSVSPPMSTETCPASSLELLT